MQEIKLHETVMVPVEKVRYDPSNPNMLSEAEMDGLRESMRRIGYLDPLILDKNYLIADGEHRATIYKEFGRTEIPAIVLDLTDAERRLLRQAKNKIRGTHDPVKDAAELKILLQSDKLAELSKLIAVDERKLLGKIADQDDLESLAKQQLPSIYEIVIECKDEPEQERIYNELKAEGYKLRILTL